jgi:hypothetical protein
MTAQYDFEWHLKHRDQNVYSAERVIELLLSMLTVRSVVDFGCGDGVWLRAFEARGVDRILGYDGPWNCVDRLLVDPSGFLVKDLSKPVDPPMQFDMALCLEVAEHLPHEASPTLVRSLCAHAPVVLFGAAIPGQGGYRHINEQWQSFWIGLFRQNGFVRFDVVRPEIWDDPAVYPWYKQNIGLFVSEARADISDTLQAAAASAGIHDMPPDVVHPDLFRAISTYEQIAFRPLSRRLMPAVYEKLLGVVKDRLA